MNQVEEEERERELIVVEKMFQIYNTQTEGGTLLSLGPLLQRRPGGGRDQLGTCETSSVIFFFISQTRWWSIGGDLAVTSHWRAIFDLAHLKMKTCLKFNFSLKNRSDLPEGDILRNVRFGSRSHHRDFTLITRSLRESL